MARPTDTSIPGKGATEEQSQKQPAWPRSAGKVPLSCCLKDDRSSPTEERSHRSRLQEWPVRRLRVRARPGDWNGSSLTREMGSTGDVVGEGAEEPGSTGLSLGVRAWLYPVGNTEPQQLMYREAT